MKEILGKESFLCLVLMNKMRTERLGKMKILGDFDKSDCRGLVGIKATRELKVMK